MLDVAGRRVCCDRCAGSAASATAARIARRRLLKSAILAAHDDPAGGSRDAPGGWHDPPGPRHDPAGGFHGLAAPGFPDAGQQPRAVIGTLIDASPQVVVIGNGRAEQRFTLTADATAWRGGPIDPAGLRPGEQVVVRLHPVPREVADRVWASIGRVTGTIIEHTRDGLVVDAGSTRGRQLVVIPARATGRIQVRFPNLEPGYLLDVVGIRRGGVLEALIPATSQPAYRSDRLPPAALLTGHVPGSIKGSATWHDAADEPHGVLGVTYPAIDPAAGCAEDAIRGSQGVIRLPYLALGSTLLIRNDCTGASCVLPVTGCAPVARLFNDRCVTCGTSPRGRVADLTLASFVALGGELERGCFNATITLDR
jgi:hypothetical protein